MRWPSELRFSRLSRHTLVHNALSLYGVQIANYILPLALIPYLARVLGASGWGLVAFGQGFGTYLFVLVEYGFFLSANRDVARCRDDRDKLAEILAGVLGAKALLGVGCLLAALLAYLWIPIFRENPVLWAAAVFWGLSQGFSMNWLFQGLERMRLVAAVEIPTRVLATLGIFLLVHRPENGWLVLILQGSGFALSALIGLVLAYRQLPFRLPTWASSREALRAGKDMFMLKGSLSFYTTGNAFLLGLFVSPQSVGYFTAAERISRASLRLLSPITQTLYPRVSYLIHHAWTKALRLARLGVFLVGASGLALALLIFIAAPWLIRIITGPGFDPAIQLLRILALLPVLIALSHAFGEQWMIPLGMESSVTPIVLLAGVVNLGLAVILVPRYADLGMACTAVAAEAVVASGLYMTLCLRRLDPLRSTVRNEEGAG